MEHDDEMERLQFLKGTVEAYAKQVQNEAKTIYVPMYPIVVELLKRGLEPRGNVKWFTVVIIFGGVLLRLCGDNMN